MPLDFCKHFLFQRQIFEHRLDHVIGLAHGASEIGAGKDALDSGLIIAEILEIRADARRRAVETFLYAIVDAHIVTGERKYLRDAVSHEAGANDGNARFCRHGQPAV